VMALWGLAWLGSTPIGGPIVGWVGQAAGARWSLVVGALPTVACGLLALPALIRIDRQCLVDRQLVDRQLAADRLDAASDANTTTELR
jgi:hypothetical protein